MTNFELCLYERANALNFWPNATQLQQIKYTAEREHLKAWGSEPAKRRDRADHRRRARADQDRIFDKAIRLVRDEYASNPGISASLVTENLICRADIVITLAGDVVIAA